MRAIQALNASESAKKYLPEYDLLLFHHTKKPKKIVNKKIGI
jgi:hypothetical protein